MTRGNHPKKHPQNLFRCMMRKGFQETSGTNNHIYCSALVWNNLKYASNLLSTAVDQEK